MSKSITIRNVPDQARDELAERPYNRSLLEAIRERKRQTGTALSAERILQLRDADRR